MNRYYIKKEYNGSNQGVIFSVIDEHICGAERFDTLPEAIKFIHDIGGTRILLPAIIDMYDQVVRGNVTPLSGVSESERFPTRKEAEIFIMESSHLYDATGTDAETIIEVVRPNRAETFDERLVKIAALIEERRANKEAIDEHDKRINDIHEKISILSNRDEEITEELKKLIGA